MMSCEVGPVNEILKKNAKNKIEARRVVQEPTQDERLSYDRLTGCKHRETTFVQWVERRASLGPNKRQFEGFGTVITILVNHSYHFGAGWDAIKDADADS